ncbi:amidase family protein [Mycobacterium sp. 1465703.0]|uniref:amidase family protein n=1 Tax=Mycobacterium sp. 1465703.0 TaxID=1834078 RepID=UPI000A953F25|nr:amidase family protein [Mycobacterium sp. 1465703.0]
MRKLAFLDGYDDKLAAAQREGDPGALNVLARLREQGIAFDLTAFSKLLIRRATVLREWMTLFENYSVLVIPASAELPFANRLDMQGDAAFARVLAAQLPQLGLPHLGLPALTVSTGLPGSTPVGVQIVAGRHREDLCPAAGESIEAAGTPVSPIDPMPG